ncbi:hypothetical protein BU26DRAFT_567753 [Trematosphaeria pertusa]|uniref:Uncharacterized protein n=1 Tax=Trematosphaeria pertusa TaxID=390896 RepID=A0A6A6I7E2_9PLEO|nr:uncharacterized protein BU26DRAFT_567753 [Trematosphaeria pertusa]KAF2246266.1 hypothetical protein BU26DRAFT_567753 [Trematosphaeria pertusa]
MVSASAQSRRDLGSTAHGRLVHLTSLIESLGKALGEVDTRISRLDTIANRTAKLQAIPPILFNLDNIEAWIQGYVYEKRDPYDHPIGDTPPITPDSLEHGELLLGRVSKFVDYLKLDSQEKRHDAAATIIRARSTLDHYTTLAYTKRYLLHIEQRLLLS